MLRGSRGAEVSEEQRFWIMGDCLRVIHSGADYGLVEGVTIPGGQGPPFRYYADADVAYEILEGELEIQLDGEWRTFRQHESVRIEKGVPHDTRNASDREVKWRARWVPGGFERFIVECGVPATEEKACERSFSGETVTRVVVNSGKFGLKFPEIDPIH
jgi:quercetin dioxygenase-like cupin family protein